MARLITLIALVVFAGVARAQATYDCWIEQATENFQPKHIAACRDAFYAAMAIIEGPRPVAGEAYFVFFDFDRTNITPEAQTVLNQVLSDESAVLHDGAEVAFFPPVTGG